jgi:hypothetical protein
MSVLATHGGIHIGGAAAQICRGSGAGGEQRQQSEPGGPHDNIQFGSPEFRLAYEDRPRRTSPGEAVGRVVAAGGRAVADRVGHSAGLAGPEPGIVRAAAKDFARRFIFALENLVF